MTVKKIPTLKLGTKKAGTDKMKGGPLKKGKVAGQPGMAKKKKVSG